MAPGGALLHGYLDVRMCTLSLMSTLQGLLQSHEKVETEVKAYNSEVDGLKALSRKIVESSFSVPPTLVSAGEGSGCMRRRMGEGMEMGGGRGWEGGLKGKWREHFIIVHLHVGYVQKHELRGLMCSALGQNQQMDLLDMFICMMTICCFIIIIIILQGPPWANESCGGGCRRGTG